jgi:hypothetical protein
VFGEAAKLAKQLAHYKMLVAADFLGRARELLDARSPKETSAAP